VVHNPATPTNGGSFTGFFLIPVSSSTFQFDPIVDIGVRVFFVSSNQPISLQPISSQSYTELLSTYNYVFANGVPFYLGLYTGNDPNGPVNGIYSDPLFGWAELENVNGTIYLLNSALEYQGGGIYAGTQTIIPTPEPSELALAALGTFLFAFRWRRNFPRV
jgi:predicted outer membrane repeat protein